jgi:hypothetical protein
VPVDGICNVGLGHSHPIVASPRGVVPSVLPAAGGECARATRQKIGLQDLLRSNCRINYCILILFLQASLRRVLCLRHNRIAGAAPVKTCFECQGKLGLGSRARNLWNGRWWSHVYFCSTRCEDRYELERSEANAKHRWRSFLLRGSAHV